MTETKTIQTYECRLRRAKVLRVADLGGETRVVCAEALARAGHALTAALPHEQLWVLLLGGAFDVRGAVRVSEGGLHGTAVRPSDILRVVLLSGCDNYALVHNHPSGVATPSQADREMTRTCHRASEVVGVHLIDHVIVTRQASVWHAMGPEGEQ